MPGPVRSVHRAGYLLIPPPRTGHHEHDNRSGREGSGRQGQAAARRPLVLGHRPRRGLHDPRDARRGRDLPDHPVDPRPHARRARPRRCSRPTSGTTSGRSPSAPSGCRSSHSLMAVPLSVAVALFISHYAPRRLAQTLGYIVDLLAAVPSVVFGLWGIMVLAPAVQPVYAWLDREHGLVPALRRPGLQHRPHDLHGGDRPRRHGRPDHHRDLPRDLPADARSSTRRPRSPSARRAGR